MYSFEYSKASDVNQAAKILHSDSEAKLLAGGMTLLPSMKHRLAAPSQLVDIAALPELRGIAARHVAGRDALSIGAAMRHAEVASNSIVKSVIPALAELAGLIGDPQVRARGTLGGSVANNDPGADYPAAVLALQATLRTNQREIAADDFFLGMFTTLLRTDEIMVSLDFAVPRRAAYVKLAQIATGYAMTGVMIAQYPDQWRVAITGAGPSVFRWREAEQALAACGAAQHLGAQANTAHDKTLQSAIATLRHPATDLTADIHASAAYRAHMIGVMTREALSKLITSTP
jgi:aerobic carbon-monoxide dehydrogenase medium subunit